MVALYNSHPLTGKNFSGPSTVLIENGKIKSVSEPVPDTSIKRIDAGGNYLVPGFIDLQIYGSGGALFSAVPTPETLAQMEADLLKKGTTGFLACVATNTDEVVKASITAAKTYRLSAKGFLGLHLEGPYLNPKKRGAHIEALIRKASLDEVKRLLDFADGVVRMMTIAPELQDDAVISYLLDNGVVLSMGHSDATFDEATMAYNKGIATTTHLFNAMSPIHHRQPGIPAAVFNHPQAMASIIADGHHVDFEVIRFSQKLLKDRLFLITDAVTSCDEGPYRHRLSGNKFITADGTLSGSNITLLDAVKNCVAHCGIRLEDALQMASAYPARLIGLGPVKGRISAGYDAGLLLLNKDLELIQVIS